MKACVEFVVTRATSVVLTYIFPGKACYCKSKGFGQVSPATEILIF
jgi:hypothetical protein